MLAGLCWTWSAPALDTAVQGSPDLSLENADGMFRIIMAQYYHVACGDLISRLPAQVLQAEFAPSNKNLQVVSVQTEGC